MRGRTRLAVVPAVAMLVLVASAGLGAQEYDPPRTSWGDPDFQGIWTTDDGRSVPLQRPAEFGTRRYLTDEEYAARKQRDDETRGDTQAGAGTFVGEVGTRSLRETSLVVDPPDGRIPDLTSAAQALAAERQAASRTRGPADSWHDRSMMERCISRGPLGIMPGLYGNGLRIVQGPGYVAVSYEMVHETRVIPLDAGQGATPNIRSHLGTSHARWEGDTLVVETAQFNDQISIARTPTSPQLRLIERFTRVATDRIDYEVTVTDPETWVEPWQVLLPLTTQPGYLVLPFECHEGNYALRNILNGARVEEAAYEDAIRRGLPPPDPPSREAEAGILPRDPSFGRPR